MPLKTNVLGMSWRYPDCFVVGREKIREFAKAVKAEDPVSFDEDAAAEAGYDALVAPLTFVSIFAKLVQADFFRSVDTGFTTMQMVQVDQKFLYHKPITVGDRLYAQMDIISVEERFGATVAVTKNLCTNQDGELVLEAYTTMMGREDDSSVNLKWDVESGQVVKTA
ncbi:(3R)-hydroxyacyl-ACP dehydratase subunit HadC [Mycobacterium sp. pUA109]|uniref:(3R)-hydroxyacyl-ACP dehydratase subunit HadC n=1 Tax=Mycobacterium sp. pUA109 TaxID=3238982 RepID=UPI00351B9B61